jgi:hypothetical protein
VERWIRVSIRFAQKESKSQPNGPPPAEELMEEEEGEENEEDEDLSEEELQELDEEERMNLKHRKISHFVQKALPKIVITLLDRK